MRKERKLIFLDNGMLNAINMYEPALKPKLVENASGRVVFELQSKKSIWPNLSYWLDEYGKEIDLILQDKEIIPIEVKYQNQILKKDLFAVNKFLGRFRLNKGIIVTKDLFDRQVINKKKIIFIPAWLFMLCV